MGLQVRGGWEASAVAGDATKEAGPVVGRSSTRKVSGVTRTFRIRAPVSDDDMFFVAAAGDDDLPFFLQSAHGLHDALLGASTSRGAMGPMNSISSLIKPTTRSDRLANSLAFNSSEAL